MVVTDDELEIPLEAQTLSILGANHLDTGLGVAAADRPRTRPPVVRQLADGRAPGRTSGCTRALPATRSGSGPRRPASCRSADRARAAWRKLAPAAQDLLVGDPGPELMFDDRVYKRGALALHALRRRCGDLAFFALLHDWTDRSATAP